VSKRCGLVPTAVLFNLTHRDRKQKQLTPGLVIKTTKLFLSLSQWKVVQWSYWKHVSSLKEAIDIVQTAGGHCDFSKYDMFLDQHILLILEQHSSP